MAMRDKFNWVENIEDPEVLKLIKDNNLQADLYFKDSEDIREELFNSIKKLIYVDKESIKMQYKDYLYFTRIKKDDSLPSHIRIKLGTSKEEILLNEEKESKGKFFSTSNISISPCSRYMAYGVDKIGNEIYQMRVIDLKYKKTIKEVENVSGSNAIFSSDSTRILFLRQDKTYRLNKLYALDLLTNQETLLHEEKDVEFSLSINESRDEKYVILTSQSTTKSKLYILDKEYFTKVEAFNSPQNEVLEILDSFNGKFYILSNFEQDNFELYEAFLGQSRDKYISYETNKDNKLVLEDFLNYNNDITLLNTRSNGRPKIAIKEKNKELNILEETDPYSYSYIEDSTPENPYFTYIKQNWISPDEYYTYNIETNSSTLIKKEEVGDFIEDAYTETNYFALSEDKTRVPYTLLQNRKVEQKGTLLMAYGAYGVSYDPELTPTFLPLLDRGINIVIANVRGGGEFGKRWHDGGRLLKKKNTFYDTISVAEDLFDRDLVKEKNLFLRGGSAGGLLVAATTNLRPDLFKGVIVEVPFVDALRTISNPELPLTTGEYQEWGNPAVKEYYDYIKSYSPTDNIDSLPYPAYYIETGLNDPRVGFWEGTILALELRERTTSGKPVILRTQDEGHAGATDRWKFYKDATEYMSFILKNL